MAVMLLVIPVDNLGLPFDRRVRQWHETASCDGLDRFARHLGDLAIEFSLRHDNYPYLVSREEHTTDPNTGNMHTESVRLPNE